MFSIHRSYLLVLAAAALAWGCEDAATSDAEGVTPTGTLHAALAFAGDTHDVAAMRYQVIAADGVCGEAEPIAEAITPLEAEALPEWLAEGAGDQHAFADALFVLQPGDYKVCVTPLTEDGEPSAICAPTEGVFAVTPEQTTEVVLYSQCLGDPSGGLDVIAALNDPPHIDDLDIEPSKFITQCEVATVTVTASDPNGDPLSYEWAITGGAPGANIQAMGATANFTAVEPGPYQVTVTVSDGIGGTATLSFPIHVSDEECRARVATLDLNPVAEALIARGFEIDAYGYDGDYDWLTTDNYDLLFLGRYAFRWQVVTPALVAALEAYSAAGGNIVTEWDGLSLMGSGYHPTYRYLAGAPAPIGWFPMLVGAGQNRGSNTPVNIQAPGDRIFAGVADPIQAPAATEFFFTVYPDDPDGSTGLQTLATFPGNGTINFPNGELATILRGARCGGNVLLITFDYQDDPGNVAFDPFLFNLVGEGVAPVPVGVIDACP